MKTVKNQAKKHYIWKYSLKRELCGQVCESQKIESPAEVAEFLKSLDMQSLEQEHFVVLFLDTKHQLKGYTTVTIGLVDRSQVHAREVFRNAILCGCSRIILAHNHPSGDPCPSSQDIACTKSLVEAGKIIGIDVLDHVVLGMRSLNRCREYISFREENLLKSE